MENEVIEINKVYNCDALELMQKMKEQGIKADWLIADPPYGIGVGSMAYTNGVKRVGRAAANRRDYSNTGDWDKQRLTKEYFDLMFQVSKNYYEKGSKWLDKEMSQVSIFDFLKTDK